jgi:predicted hydrocarbon binding protein
MMLTATADPLRGTPAGRHNYYNDEDFVRPDPARGTARDAAGRRLVRASADFLAALHSALDREVGDAAGDVLYKLGRRWGEADFQAFGERAPREFGVANLDQMHFNVMLESWRWPLTTAGWGTWRYDFRRARQGLPVVALTNSAVAAAVGKTSKPICHLYAGLFAAVFGSLARRELAGIELECAATGADGCRFLVASAAKAAAAAKLRDEGVAAEAILDRLSASATGGESRKDQG